jgi:hypothetical protein
MLESNTLHETNSYLPEDSLSPVERTKIIRDEHDSILTPIEKLQRTEVTKKNVDCMLSPTEKENAVVPTAQEKPEKKRFFSFDLDDSFTNAKNKV